MKKSIYLILVLSVVVLAFSNSAMAQKGVQHMTITPVPVVCELSVYDYVPLTKIVISTDDESAVKWANKYLALWYKNLAPKVYQKRIIHPTLTLNLWDTMFWPVRGII